MGRLRPQDAVSIYPDWWIVLGTVRGTKENEHNFHAEKLSFKPEAPGGF